MEVTVTACPNFAGYNSVARYDLTSVTLQIDDGCFANEAAITAGTPSVAAFEAFNP